MDFSEKALKLILDSEGNCKPSDWPGGPSGVTIGYGYDLGYVTKNEFLSDWSEELPKASISKLANVVGARGTKAREFSQSPQILGIKIPDNVALKVFISKTLPKYTQIARRALDGFDSLPLNAQGALVSLIYNRGPAMLDSDQLTQNRREMRAIRNLVSVYSSRDDKKKVLQEIANQLRSMKRLWKDKKLDGLITRRENEAKLVEESIQEVV